jgi:hypothetical protein
MRTTGGMGKRTKLCFRVLPSSCDHFSLFEYRSSRAVFGLTGVPRRPHNPHDTHFTEGV